MAPQSNPASALQQNRSRPTVQRPIVPAIPLPYIQKRKQQEAARAKAKEEARALVLVDTPIPSTPAVVEIESPAVNGSADTKIEKAEEPSVPTVTSTPAAPLTPTPEPVKEENTAAVPEVSTPAETTGQPQEISKSTHSGTPSDASRSTYHMPPPFVPGVYANGTGEQNGILPQNFNNGQYRPIHHPHPSSGSVMFGAYPESNNSSPQPPQSGGFMPPPFPMQQMPQHGQSRHAPHHSNGGYSQHHPSVYSPMGPPPPPGYYPGHNGFMNHGPPAESFARRPPGFSGPMDSHTPTQDVTGRFNNFDLATPNSFHGSQSSATNDGERGPAFYNQYPTGPIPNDSNGHVEETRLHQAANSQPRAGVQQPAPSMNNYKHVTSNDDLDGMVGYLQSQFADPAFADYTLELRYADDRAPPVRVPGHNLMFARSPTLKQRMNAQAQENSPDGITSRTLLLETKDRFLRSDGFWMAVQRLYGVGLLEFGPLPTISFENIGAPIPGTPQERFDFALGYAAAGTLLQIPPVMARGCEIASLLIDWSNVEKALDFALDGGLPSQWIHDDQFDHHRTNTYGPCVNMIIHYAMSYLIANFPAGFELDASVPDPIFNRRLPFVPEVRGAGQNPRLSLIKFGDHPSEESMKTSNTNAITLTLSKLLINLPYHLLKYVLESSRLGNVQGWATAALRNKVMRQVIEEREKRRAKVVNSAVPLAERKANSVDWEPVGWKESVVPLDGNESTPTLTREWVGLDLPDSS